MTTSPTSFQRTETPPTVLVGGLVDIALDHLDNYRELGGGRAVERARMTGPAAVVDDLVDAGLRGRGGAGFPTGRKWQTLMQTRADTRYVACNAAEGEPGCFKDRWLLRRNPYAVLEGMAVACITFNAPRAFLVLSDHFESTRARVEQAVTEVEYAGWFAEGQLQVVAGPEAYLLGEETAMLEAIEGRAPMPRVLPPYQVGLFSGPGRPNPTLVNNAETFAHVATIVGGGPAAFRALGTAGSPGTMLFTVCGDVVLEGVFELPLGTPMSELVHDVAGGPPDGRAVKAVIPGASGGLLTAEHLATPLDFEAMAGVGSALGAGGFEVVDEAACMVRRVALLARFLADESCAQCPACSEGTRDISERIDRLEAGSATTKDLERIEARCRNVTGGARCGLPAGAQALVSSALEHFGDEFRAHLDGGCPLPADDTRLPMLVDFDGEHFRLDDRGPVGPQARP